MLFSSRVFFVNIIDCSVHSSVTLLVHLLRSMDARCNNFSAKNFVFHLENNFFLPFFVNCVVETGLDCAPPN